ncbi:MAG: hypothetical protein JWQ89_2239 [Devosia sp.]|uniref:DUF1353 domain-containing protein n=1 Tax=Devosia sp. TaxID=1871048 RepID=UPI002619775B|nr:DUF1353 domain-containing protein [Devosia sp.]MDB5540512.1 hypothetical protein [Devosia sp.]
MSIYTTAQIQPLDGDWQLVTPLVWEVGKLGTGLFIEAPAGFVTDLASIPWWLGVAVGLALGLPLGLLGLLLGSWWALAGALLGGAVGGWVGSRFNGYSPEIAKAAIVHDFLLYEDWCHMTAAGEFYNALRADGVTLWRRVVMFLAVLLASDRW